MTTNKKHYRPAGDGSIYKDEKRGRWIAQLHIGYDSRSGRSIKRTRTCSTQKEAREALASLREKYTSQTALLADRLTVRDWLLRWFETYSRPRIRPNSAETYERVLHYAIDAVGRIPLGELTSCELQNIINTRLHSHARSPRIFKSIMHMAFQRAVQLRLIRENPAACLELPKPKPRKPYTSPTKENRDALLAAETRLYCWRWILLTEYMTGLRRSELLALRWEDIDLENGWLCVRHSLINGKKEPGMTIRPIYLAAPKTATSKRKLFIPPALCKELAAYKAKQAALRLHAGQWAHPETVFTRADGSWINPSYFSALYYANRQKLGIRTTFHMLRHDMASRMKASHQFDFKDIQAQLGHSTIQVTMDIYTHIDDQQKAAVSSWLENDATNLFDTPDPAPKRKTR